MSNALPLVQKRPSNQSKELAPLLKKPRAELGLVRATSDKAKQLAQTAATRTSSLESPIVTLENAHWDELYCGKFHKKGTAFVAAGAERSLSFWAIYGKMENYHLFSVAMNGAIVSLNFDNKDGDHFIVGSTDHACGYFDMHKCMRVRKLQGHEAIINDTCFARDDVHLAASAADDSTVRLLGLDFG